MSSSPLDMYAGIERDFAWFSSMLPLFHDVWQRSPDGLTCEDLLDRLQSVTCNEMLADDFDALNHGRKRALGRYHEALLSALLAKAATDMVSNIPLSVDGRVVGELDFLARFDNVWLHLEVATKYYLYVGDGDMPSDDPDRWLGPGLKDRLGRKRDKLARQAGENILLPAAKAALATRQVAVPDIIDSHALVTGCLFYPLAQWQQASHPVPPGLVPGSETGWWCTQSAWQQLHVARWQMVEKPDWLSAGLIAPQPGQHAILPDRPVMVVTDDMPGAAGRSRGFVVPDAWPAAAKALLTGG